jgi:hypothetical protein
VTPLRKRLLLVTGLILISSSFFLGNVLLKTALSSLESSSQLKVSYEEASINPFTGKVSLLDVSIQRPLPDFVDVAIPTLNIDIDISRTLGGSVYFDSVEMNQLNGRVITKNIPVPFTFSKCSLENFSPDHLVDGVLFNSAISGYIWQSNIEITSRNMTISPLPIDQLNRLFDSPITGFRSGLLSIATLSNWEVVDHTHSATLQIRLSGHRAFVPDSFSGLERLFASQLVAYVNRQKSMDFTAPIKLDRSTFTGDITQDFTSLFQTIGNSMIETLPSQFSNIKGSRHVNSNPLNLSNKHIQSIQEKLQSFLNE